MLYVNNWSDGRVELRTINNEKVLYFLSNDFIINKAYLDKPARVEADWVFKGLEFGLIVKYNSNGFLLFSLNGTYASISKVFNNNGQYNGYVIGGVPYSCAVDSQITLAVDMTDTTYTFYANNEQLLNIKIDDNRFWEGQVGLYSYEGNYCKEFRIYTEVPTGWTFAEPTDELINVRGV